MKIEFTVDLDDVLDHYEPIDTAIRNEIMDQIMKGIKRDSRYKAYIAKKQSELLDKLSVEI